MSITRFRKCCYYCVYFLHGSRFTMNTTSVFFISNDINMTHIYGNVSLCFCHTFPSLIEYIQPYVPRVLNSSLRQSWKEEENKPVQRLFCCSYSSKIIFLTYARLTWPRTGDDGILSYPESSVSLLWIMWFWSCAGKQTSGKTTPICLLNEEITFTVCYFFSPRI